MEFLYKFLVFTIALSVIVFVHEYGHFWVARKNGVKVDAFSIGFGPEFFGFTDKLGTRWKFSVIPLGGYVQMHGDADVSSRPGSKKLSKEEQNISLEGKTPLQRIAVASAGPIANFIFTIVVFAFLFTTKGVTVISPIIQSIKENSIAEKAGLKTNDKIITINDEKVDNFIELRVLLKDNAGKEIHVVIERDGEEKKFDIEMMQIDEKTGDKKPVSILGFSPSTEFKPVTFFEGITEAFTMTFKLIYTSLSFIISLITFQDKSAEIGGIITIGDQVTKAAEHGMWTLLEFMAFLSLQLGVINLLPVPVLDGGHILMNTIELMIRRPLSEAVQGWLYHIGAGFVFALMGYGLLSDISRYALFEKALSLLGLN